tara:strand:+ start:143 stop:538 length:396 start_codon:yes stop_codon:yes gene_type:complete
MINKVILLGRLGSDPEVKISTKDSKFAKMSIATSERYKDKSGEMQEKSQWHNIVCWDSRLADTIEKYCKKGTLVYIEGQLETRKYDKDGETRYTTEVILPQFKGQLKLVGGKPSGQSSQTSTTETNEDIPF